MIPSVVASEVTGALRDFLATGFGPSNPALANVVDDFLAEPGNLAKGPYLSIALPFQPAPEGGEPFPKIPLGFTPYRHQRIAFSRLAASAGPGRVYRSRCRNRKHPPPPSRQQGGGCSRRIRRTRMKPSREHSPGTDDLGDAPRPPALWTRASPDGVDELRDTNSDWSDLLV